MTKWLDKFTPDDYVSSVYDIDLGGLWASGKRLLLSDLDNTLVPWNAPEIPSTLADWVRTATAIGFQVCIVSNNEVERVKAFSQRSGIDALGKARKPRPDAIFEAMKRYGCTAQQTVMIGDQLFTDMQAANRAGVHSVLVLPIHTQEWWPTQLVRRVERIILNRLAHTGRVKRPVRPLHR